MGKSAANTISCNLAEEIPALPALDLVIHNAGLAHRIPKTPEEERDFFQVNLGGTQNLLQGLEHSNHLPNTFIFISTVAVYGLEKGEMIAESQLPNPHTPYGKSKYEAELLLKVWCEKKQVNLVVLRLPLVAGGQRTPGNLGAMIRAIQKGYYFRVGKGNGRKSMVLASDIAQLISTLNGKSGIYNLTDGVHPSIMELDEYLAGSQGKKVRTLPFGILKTVAKIGDWVSFFPLNTYRINKLSESLTFDDSKARMELGWDPKPVVGNIDL